MLKRIIPAAALMFVHFPANAVQNWNFSFVSGGGTLSGGLSGILQPDSNSIVISAVRNVVWNGQPPQTPTLLVSIKAVFGYDLAALPTTSLNGSIQDFGVCIIVCSEGFIIGDTTDTGTLDFETGAGFSAVVEPYSSANWSISLAPTVGVPEPASWAMLIAGFGLVGAVARRRPQVRAA